jgi:hypothetical protein
MNIDEYLSHNEELFATPSDMYWSPLETLAEFGPDGGLGA